MTIASLAQALGERARCGEPLSRRTTVRIGGPADLYAEAVTSQALCELVMLASQHQVPCLVLGGGSNVLVGDAGVRGLVIANKARAIHFQVKGDLPEISVRAESGVVLPTLARQSIERGYANLEWAVGVPGSVGGAVVGNAGAHGSNVAGILIEASVLEADGTVRDWTNAEFAFGYRSSALKTRAQAPVVLAATLRLQADRRETLEARAAEFAERRRHSQPPGATMGSTFKNPPGDYAGRLIEAAGLKGTRIGDAQISPVHANFFINLGGATASDMMALIDLARARVLAQFGVNLELEIELIGEQA